jgi:hypothetical protein
MVPHITQLEREFTRYSLQMIANMTSAYAIRLYELLVQWGNVGERTVEVAWLKESLMLERDYPRMFDFKRRVIDVAVAQINDYSDLTVRYTQRKTGRTVTHLIFIFAHKTPPAAVQASPLCSDSDMASESELFQRLRHHGIGVRLARTWLRQDTDRVRAALDRVETRARQGQITGSTAGYLRALFESDGALGPSTFERERAAQARAEAQASKRRDARQRRRNQQEQAAQQQARAAVSALSPAARRALAQDYRQGAGAALATTWDDALDEPRDALARLHFTRWLHQRVGEQEG